jgi:hypothetical protein
VSPAASTATTAPFEAAETNEVPVPKPGYGRHKAGEPSTKILITGGVG